MPPTIRTIIDDPSVSYWLKRAIREMQDRDPVDAVNDAEALAEIMREGLAVVLGHARA
jgi:hypothetical protein